MGRIGEGKFMTKKHTQEGRSGVGGMPKSVFIHTNRKGWGTNCPKNGAHFVLNVPLPKFIKNADILNWERDLFIWWITESIQKNLDSYFLICMIYLTILQPNLCSLLYKLVDCHYPTLKYF